MQLGSGHRHAGQSAGMAERYHAVQERKGIFAITSESSTLRQDLLDCGRQEEVGLDTTDGATFGILALTVIPGGIETNLERRARLGLQNEAAMKSLTVEHNFSDQLLEACRSVRKQSLN